MADQHVYLLTGSEPLDNWLLKVELDGEWEECAFQTRSEALTAFLALFHDYASLMKKAILFSPERTNPWRRQLCAPASRLIH
jgi:hypothetical protein